MKHFVQWLKENDPKVLKHPNVQFNVNFPNLPEPVYRDFHKLMNEKLVPEHYVIYEGSHDSGNVEFTEKGFEYIEKL